MSSKHVIWAADSARSKTIYALHSVDELKKLGEKSREACALIAEADEKLKGGELSLEDYEKVTREIKMAMPVVLPQMDVKDAAVEGQIELMSDRVCKGWFVMVDVEQKDLKAIGLTVAEFYDRYVKGNPAVRIREALSKESSRHGYHGIFRLPNGMTIPEGQTYIWKLIDAPVRLDTSTKDIRRRMFWTTWDHVIYYNESLLFDEDEDENGERLFNQAEQLTGIKLSEAQVGERHEKLKQLLAKTGLAQALDRDDIVDQVAERCPEWFRTDRQDIENLVRDFAEKYKDTPVRVSQKVEANGGAAATSYEWKPRHDDYNDPELFQPLAKYWPSGLLQAAKWLGDSSMVLPGLSIWLPSLAACISTKVKATDPGGYHQPPLMLGALIAPSGRGKSQFRLCIEQFTEILEEVSNKAREKRKKSREALRTRTASEKVQIAHDPILMTPLDCTPSAFAERLELAKGEQFLYSFDDEAGYTLANMEGWGNVAKIINNSWGLERLRVGRSSVESVEADVVCTLCCSLMMQSKYKGLWVKLIDQGAPSRVVWSSLPDYVGPVRPIAMMTDEDKCAMQELGRRLYEMKPCDYTKELKPIADLLKQWEEQRVAEAIRDGDEVMKDNGFRFRICVNAFRTAVILWACWKSQQDKTGQKKTITLRLLGSQCLYLADYWADQLKMLFGDEIIRNRNAQPDFGHQISVNGTTKSEDILGQLPETFKLKDIKAYRPNSSDSALRGMIYRWKSAGRIEEMADKNYHKL